MTAYQPKTGARCSCKRGVQRDNCPNCEGTGYVIDFAAIRARREQRQASATTLYQDCVAAGIATANHESDLYIPVNDATRQLLQKHGKKAITFTNQVEGGLWYDVPFAFDPWWESKAKA